MLSPSLATRLEAILYLKGRPVSIAELTELADVDRKSVEEALVALTALNVGSSLILLWLPLQWIPAIL